MQYVMALTGIGLFGKALLTDITYTEQLRQDVSEMNQFIDEMRQPQEAYVALDGEEMVMVLYEDWGDGYKESWSLP